MTNVYDQVARRSLTLAEKLSANNELAGMVLSLLSTILEMCRAKGMPIEGIEMSPVATQMDARELLMSSHITFNRLALPVSRLWKPSGDFEVFTAARANGLGAALAKNPRLTKFFQSLCEKLDAYARHKRIPFSDLQIKNPFISKDNVLVIGVGKDA